MGQNRDWIPWWVTMIFYWVCLVAAIVGVAWVVSELLLEGGWF